MTNYIDHRDDLLLEFKAGGKCCLPFLWLVGVRLNKGQNYAIVPDYF